MFMFISGVYISLWVWSGHMILPVQLSALQAHCLDTQPCMWTRRSHRRSLNLNTSFSHTGQVQLLTHNLTMNQVSADQSAYKFKIQHLPSLYWRTFGTALFWPADTFTIYTHPKQKLALNSWAFSRTLMQMQTAVLSCPPLPFAACFYSASYGLSLVREQSQIVSIQGANPAGEVCLPTCERLSGVEWGLASLYQCPLLHQQWWHKQIFFQDYWYYFSSDWMKSLQTSSHAVLQSELLLLLLFLTTEPQTGKSDDPWWSQMILDFVAPQNTHIWPAAPVSW